MTGPLLRQYRARLGLTQKAMAARFGMSVRTYQGFEQGYRRGDDALLIGLLRELLAPA
jgi:transcriptional regulator with XRE-family HTH domain